MINPASYNITAYQGATFDLTLTWTIDGTPVNLSTYSARMKVKSAPLSTESVISLTNGSGITLGGSAGTIALLVSASTMAGISAGTYVYDLELDSGTVVTRLMQGKFSVQAEVTK
jgi:hypothetical protein